MIADAGRAAPNEALRPPAIRAFRNQGPVPDNTVTEVATTLRIVYGVNGYGRGHAMRAAAVMPELAARHEVLILAGADAYDALAADFRVVRIPNLRYYYRRGGRLAVGTTLKRNLPMALDLMWAGASVEMTKDIVREFRADLVLMDGEGFVLRAARQLGIPSISLDNIAQLAYCQLGLRGLDALKCWGNGFMYRLLFGVPDRIIITSFFEAPTTRPGIRTVGPLLRREVRNASPTRGDFLLAYISKESELTSNVEAALQEAGCLVRLYGAARRGRDRAIEYCELSNTRFVADLAGCRAIYGTTGNTLMAEVRHLRKPMLGVPIDCMEQRLNAIQLERLGFGVSAERDEVSPALVHAFLAREAEFRSALPADMPDGVPEAVAAIEAFARELNAGTPSDSGKPTAGMSHTAATRTGLSTP